MPIGITAHENNCLERLPSRALRTAGCGESVTPRDPDATMTPSRVDPGVETPDARGARVLLLVGVLGVGGAERHMVTLANELSRDAQVLLVHRARDAFGHTGHAVAIADLQQCYRLLVTIARRWRNVRCGALAARYGAQNKHT